MIAIAGLCVSALVPSSLAQTSCTASATNCESYAGVDNVWQEYGLTDDCDTLGTWIQDRTPTFTCGDITNWSYLGDELGYNAYGVGDVNGDGRDDWAVTWYLRRVDHGSFSINSGFVQVYGFNSSAEAEVIGEESITVDDVEFFDHQVWTRGATNEKTAHTIMKLPDIDGDGRDEMLLSIPMQSANSGGVWLYSYTDAYTGTEQWVKVLHVTHPGVLRFGWRVEGEGDYNGDGTNDILIGAKGWDEEPNQSSVGGRAGAAFVILLPGPDVWQELQEDTMERFLADNEIDESEAHEIAHDAILQIDVGDPSLGTTPRQYSIKITDENQTAGEGAAEFGTEVRSAGDIDCDGADDICVGWLQYQKSGDTTSDRGAAYVFLSSSGVHDPFKLDIVGGTGLEPFIRLGTVTAGTGADYDNDGSVVVTDNDGSCTYQLDILDLDDTNGPTGSTTTVSPAVDLIIEGRQQSGTGDRFGATFARGGDYTGDGSVDGVYCASGAGSSSAGEIYLFDDMSTRLIGNCQSPSHPTTTQIWTIDGAGSDEPDITISPSGDMSKLVMVREGGDLDDPNGADEFLVSDGSQVFVFSATDTPSYDAQLIWTIWNENDACNDCKLDPNNCDICDLPNSTSTDVCEGTSVGMGMSRVWTAGDVNSDRLDDVIAAAWFFPREPGSGAPKGCEVARAGKAYVFLSPFPDPAVVPFERVNPSTDPSCDECTSPTPPPLDLDRDGHVDLADVLLMLQALQASSPSLECDFDYDGQVSFSDLFILLDAFR